MTIVKFYDPIAKKEISYSITDKLVKKWKPLSKLVVQKNKDRIYIVFGREREGKSTWTFQQAKFIDPTFNIKRICFTPKQFLEQIRNAPPGSVVVFDEAFRGFSSKSALSKVNKQLVQAVMEVGRRNLIIFIVSPSFSLLENYIALHRSHALFQIYERKDGKFRGWRCYNRKKKGKMYDFAKKNYGRLPFTKTKLKGKFFVKTININGKKDYIPYETFSNEEYDAKKFKAFGDEPDKEENPFQDEVRALKYTLCKMKCPIKTRKELAEKLGISYSALIEWKRHEKESKK